MEIELGGLMAEVFKIFLGNPDISVTIIVFIVFVGLVFTVIRTYYDFTE